MPISVGEVNATLRFTIIQADIAAAQKNLRALAAEFQDVGGEATTQGQRILASMIPVQNQLDILTAHAAGLKEEIKAMNAPAGDAASSLGKIDRSARYTSISMGNLDSIMSRMLVRIGLFYAIRGSIKFYTDLLNTAQALQNLDDRTGLSIEKLQALSFAGDSVGIPFSKLSTYVETLQKNLETFKGGDALHEIGLSFAQVFAMNPDARIDAIGKALQGVASPAERARLEVELFGTDAIDPLIQKYSGLAAAAKDLPFMSPQIIQALVQAKQAYEALGAGLETAAAGAASLIFKGAELVASPFFIFAANGFQGLRDAAANSDLLNHKIEALSALVNGGVTGLLQYAVSLDKVADSEKKASDIDLSKMGQEYVNSLKQQIPLTADQLSLLTQLNSMHELSLKTAVQAADVTTAQYKAFVTLASQAKSVQDAVNRSANDYAKAWLEIKSAGDGWKGTIASINADTVIAIKNDLDAGVSQHSLAVAYGLTATQVHAIAMARQEDEKEARAQEAAAKKTAATELWAATQTTETWAKVYQDKADMYASDAQKNDARAQYEYERAVAEGQKRGVTDTAYYQAKWALYEVDKEKFLAAEVAKSYTSKEELQATADNLRNVYEEMLSSSQTYTQAERDLAKQRWQDAEQQARNWEATVDSALGSTSTAFTALGKNGVAVFTSLQSALDAFAQGLDDTKIKVRLLDGELVTLQQAVDRFNAGGSITYDLSNVAGVENYRKLNPGATISLSDAQIIAMVSAGATLQSLIQAGYINPYGAYTQGGSAFPHAAEGGLVKVGERGPEIVRLPGNSIVYPSGTSAGSGMTNIYHIYVNGTAEEAAAKIEKILMQKLKAIRKFPAA